MGESALKSHSKSEKHKQNSWCEQRLTLSSFGLGSNAGTSTGSSRNKEACVEAGTSTCSSGNMEACVEGSQQQASRLNIPPPPDGHVDSWSVYHWTFTEQSWFVSYTTLPNTLLLRCVARRVSVYERRGNQVPDQLKTRFPKCGLLMMDELMAEGGNDIIIINDIINDKWVWNLFTKHSHHQNVAVLYLCQKYFQERSQHRSLQESKRSIRHEKFIVTGISHPMASFARHVSTFDRTPIWIHCLQFTPLQLWWSSDSQPPGKGRRMYVMSQIHGDIVMSSSQDSITTVSLMNRAKERALLVNKDLLYRLYGLFPFYHR